MNEQIIQRLAFLEESKESHENIAQIIVSPTLGMMSLYACAVLKRSISLIFGFTSAIRNRNYICAAPLVRLQLDNLLRFEAAFLVPDQEQFVLDFMRGRSIRGMADRDGMKMTDSRLQKRLARDYPWLTGLYGAASSHVHLSEQHLLQVLRAKKDGPEGSIEMYMGPVDQMVDDSVYENTIEDMITVTDALLRRIGAWAQLYRRQLGG